MPLTNAYRDYIAAATVGTAQTAFNAANAAIGVGNGTTAFTASQTNLQGASRLRKGMEAGYPTRSANVMVFRSLFATGDANFAWAEWGIFNSTTDASGTMMTRVVQANGTKANTETKQFTITITLTV